MILFLANTRETQINLINFTITHITQIVKKNITSITILILVLITFIYSGYKFGVHDQNLYIPIIKRFIDPSLYPKDPLVSFFGDETTIIWNIIIPFAKFFSLEIAFILFHFISFTIFLLGVHKLIFTISKNKVSAWIGVLILSISQPSLLSLTTYSHYFAPRFLALAFVTLAIQALLKNRYLKTAFFLTASVYINGIVGIPAILMIGLTVLLYQKRKIKYRDLGLFLAILIGISPIIISRIVSSNGTSSLSINRDWFEFTRNSISLFYNLPQFNNSSFETFSNIVGLLMIGTFPFIVKKVKDSVIRKKLMFLFITIIGVFFIHYILVELLPITILMQLQLNRGIVFIPVLFYSIYAVYLTNEYKKNNSKILLILGIIFGYYFIGPVFFITYEIIKKVVSNKNNLIPIIFISILFIVHFNTTKIKPSFKYLKMFSDKNDAYDIQIWLRENTSKDSLIITPPYIDEHSFASFRVHSERSILALNSELARVAISQGLEETLRTRLDDLSKDGFSPALLTGDYGKMYHAIYEGYNNLNEDDIVRLSKKYDANYFIREKPSELNLTVVYENDEYILYEI